jgi:ADP-dependent NAD(P)H-hydrate dehydratase / NAD(P)H-hydrate epimerase
MDDTLLMKLVTVAEMKAIEREADEKGTLYAQMMETAGKGVAEEVMERYSHLEEQIVLGLVGPGNNGGDALVTLAELAQAGWTARAYLAKARAEKDPLVKRASDAGCELEIFDQDPNRQVLDGWLSEASVILDGVLGTGTALPLQADMAELLDNVSAFKRSGLPGLPDVVAIDCPSGVNCDTGETAPECIPADVTLCMDAVKVGLLKFPAYSYVGELAVVDLDLPEGIAAKDAVLHGVVGVDFCREYLPKRPLDAHKGTFGTAMVVAGSINYTGAAYFSGKAAYLIGAGLVQMAVAGPLHTVLAGQLPEVTWVLLPHDTGVIRSSAVQVVRKNLDRATAMLVGPGLGSEETTGEFIHELITQKSTRPTRAAIGFVTQSEVAQPGPEQALPPLVIDADGLRLMAQVPDWHKHLPAPAILTPHPGEMSALTGMSVGEIQSDRRGTASRFAREWGHVVVLKGAMTVVAAPDGRTGTIPVATPALARAGTGDVLSGILVGLRAQKLPAYEAALLGCWIHAQAGVAAGERVGHPASVLASDVLEAIPEVLGGIAMS